MESLLPKGMLGTPRRTVVAGIAALVVATILLLVYLSHYRSSVKSANASVPVLQATDFIPKNTTADSMARAGSYEATVVPKDELKEGAVQDAAVLHGQVTLDNIYIGQQLTAADFGPSETSTALSGSPDLLGTGAKTGTWRAIAVQADSVHGLTPLTLSGDHVDVYVQSGGTLGLLMEKVLVLAAPNQAVAGATAAPTSPNYVLRIPARDAARFAFAAQNGTIWFVLRPQDERKTKPAGTTPANSSNVFNRQ